MIIFFYSFVGLSSLILLNALLAIIVDAYAAVKAKSDASLSPEIIGLIVGRAFGRSSPRADLYIPVESIHEALGLVLAGQFVRSNAVWSSSKSTLESSKTLFLFLGGSVIALDQAALQAAVQLAIGADCETKLLVYNILEQLGVDVDPDALSDNEANAFRLLRELQRLACFDSELDAALILLVIMHDAYADSNALAATDLPTLIFEEPKPEAHEESKFYI